jgi:hypothetical protein
MAFEKLRIIVIAEIPHYYLEGTITVPPRRGVSPRSCFAAPKA